MLLPLLLLLVLYSPLCRCLCQSSLSITVGASSPRIHRPTTACMTTPSRATKHGGIKRYSTTILYSTSSSSSSIVRQEGIRYIAGRRALLLHPTTHTSSMPKMTTTVSSDEPKNAIANRARHLPLVVLGGMAQTITNWVFHLSFLSQDRSVLMYEPIGQGPLPPSSEQHNSTFHQYYYNDVSLERQGEDFWNVVDEAFFTPGSHYCEQHSLTGSDAIPMIDVASFSFGGRVSLAAATIRPKRIRRLHLTGVGAERDAVANIHIACWRDLLSIDASDEVDYTINLSTRRSSPRLRSFAWSIILATYSEQFLASVGPDRIKAWVESVCQNNTEEGLRAILTQAHDNGTTDQHLWTPAAMAQRIHASQSLQQCRIMVGSKDMISHPSQALRLAEMLHVSDDEAGMDVIQDDIFKVVDGCGHSVPMEAMKIWREDVLRFLGG